MANSRRGTLLAVAALCAAALTQTADGAVFKCQDAQGKITYQQKPCEGAAKESGVDLQAAPKPQGAARPGAAVDAATASTGAKTEMSPLMLLVQKYQCDRERPNFAIQTKVNYERWRVRHAKEIAEVEASDKRPLLDHARTTSTPGVTPAQMDQICVGLARYLDQESRR
jgi:hypothetical protein